MSNDNDDKKKKDYNPLSDYIVVDESEQDNVSRQVEHYRVPDKTLEYNPYVSKHEQTISATDTEAVERARTVRSIEKSLEPDIIEKTLKLPALALTALKNTVFEANPELLYDAEAQQDFYENTKFSDVANAASEILGSELGGTITNKLLGMTKSTLQNMVKVRIVKRAKGLLSKVNKQKLPKNYIATTIDDPKLLETWDDFNTRIYTPEGQKRVKEIIGERLEGESEYMLKSRLYRASLIQDLRVKGNASYQRFGSVNDKLSMDIIKMGGNIPKSMSKTTLRHEIEHLVQGGKRTVIDKMLGKLKLKPVTNQNPLQKKIAKRKLSKKGLKERMSNETQAVEYFRTGSWGKEKSAMLSELQEYMRTEHGIDPYTEFTGEIITAMRKTVQKKGITWMRIFNISEEIPANDALIAKALNKMLQIGVPVGISTSALYKSQDENK